MKAIFAAAVFGLMACGGSSGGAGGGGGSQTCMQEHKCVNGSCTCSTGPRQGDSCCDPKSTSCTTDKCDTFCRFCQ